MFFLSLIPSFFAYVQPTIKKQKTSGFFTLDCKKPKSDFFSIPGKNTHNRDADETMRQRINIYNIENETAIITIYQMFPIFYLTVPLEQLLPASLFPFLRIYNSEYHVSSIDWCHFPSPSLPWTSPSPSCHFVLSVHVHSVIIFRCRFKIVYVRVCALRFILFLDVTLFKCK